MTTDENSTAPRGFTSQFAQLESYQEVVSQLEGLTFPIPSAYLADLICRATVQMDWPVRRAATREFINRISAAKDEKIKTKTRPGVLRTLGSYKIKDSTYITTIFSIEPLDGSCNCGDFIISSLGYCKHLHAVFTDIFSKKGSLASAKREQRLQEAHSGYLRWSPFTPPLGEQSVLAQVTWDGEFIRDKLPCPIPEWKVKKWFSHTATGAVRIVLPKTRKETLMMAQELSEFVCSKPELLDYALKTVIENEISNLKELEALSLDSWKVKSLLSNLKLPLFPYQHEGVTRFCEKTKLLLGDDMGLGKTRQAIACAHALWHAKKVSRGLFVVPASLKGQWLREWQLITETPVTIIDGDSRERAQTYKRCAEGFLVINYEQLFKDLPVILAWKPEMLVLDEAQRIKNATTKTARYIKQIMAPYRLLLTGTPFENRLEELASLMDLVDPRALEPRWRIIPWYAITSDGKNDISGARNLNSLRERMMIH